MPWLSNVGLVVGAIYGARSMDQLPRPVPARRGLWGQESARGEAGQSTGRAASPRPAVARHVKGSHGFDEQTSGANEQIPGRGQSD
jgi:hypothetical protein